MTQKTSSENKLDLEVGLSVRSDQLRWCAERNRWIEEALEVE